MMNRNSSDLVGRAPWPAADPLIGLLVRGKSRTGRSGADEDVRPTFWLRPCCSVLLDPYLLVHRDDLERVPSNGAARVSKRFWLRLCCKVGQALPPVIPIERR